MSEPDFYWTKHKKHAQNGRLAWYAESANEDFWTAHWARQLTPDYYAIAERMRLEDDETGNILLRHLTKHGQHLEAGCGGGYWVAALKQNGYNVLGIEYANDLVKLVNHRAPHLSVRCGDALALDVPDGTYDSYLSFGVVEHREAGPSPFLTEAYRVLSAQGLLVLSVPFFGPIRRWKARLRLYESSVPSMPFFQYGFSRDEIQGLLRKTGFSIVEIHPLFSHRLLIEESRTYRFLAYQRGGGILKKAAVPLLNGWDGHMVMVVAKKQA